jgi:hypothetical protein
MPAGSGETVTTENERPSRCAPGDRQKLATSGGGARDNIEPNVTNAATGVPGKASAGGVEQDFRAIPDRLRARRYRCPSSDSR